MQKPNRFTEKDLIDKGFIPHNGGYVSATIARKLNITPPEKKRKHKSQASKFSDKTDEFCRFVKDKLNILLVTEYRFDSIRKWRFDYANEDLKLAIECEGGIWRKGGGAHSRPKAIFRDMEKYTAASLQGWTIIRRTPQQLLTEETIELICLKK